MSKTAPLPRGRRPKPKISDRDVQGGRMLARIMEILAPLHDHCPDPKRNLHYDEHCAWILLYFFTPVLDSVRGLQQASDIEPIRRRFGLPRFSLGSFSEAGNVFDPQLLAAIIEDVGECLEDIETDPRLTGLQKRPTPVDGTLIRALPKMVWALWCDEEHRAAKLHLQFDILKAAPVRATLTHGQASEIEELRKNLQPGRLYIDDRGYFDFALMEATLRAGSSFVTRVRENIVYETVEERPIGQTDTPGRVQSDLLVRAGGRQHGEVHDRTLRLVRIHVPDAGSSRRGPARLDSKTQSYRTAEPSHTLVLLTDLLDMDVSLVALLYYYRWQIELFFRWFKKVLEADHLLSLSENGLTIVLYCALIASMLVTLWTGRKPTKRTYELLCFYFLGLLDDEDLLVRLDRLEHHQQPR